MTKYSILIVTYNRKKILEECLEHAINQTFKPLSICVVNNSSTDGTFEFLEELRKSISNLYIYNMDKNIGGAGGFAFGISVVDENADYILILDDDAIIEYDFLENIDLALTDDILAYSGTVITEGKVDTTHRRIVSNNVFMFKTDVNKLMYEREYFDYDLATFCGLIVSVPLIKKIGIPREDYFIWYDDTEYSLRIRQYSKIRNVNQAKLNHKVIKQNNGFLGWKSFYGYRNMWDMGCKYSRFPIVFNIYMYAFHFVKICLYSIMFVINDRKSYYKNMFILHRDIIRSRLKKQMGINIRYTWNTKF